MFAELALENGLRVLRSGESLYTALETDDGFDMYRAFAGWDQVRASYALTANPAAGANPAAVTVPAGHRHLLTHVFFTFTTDANVANRLVILTITDGTNTILVEGAGFLHTASSGRQYLFGQTGYKTTTAASYNEVPLPPMELHAGYTWQITASSLQAGDDFSALAYGYKDAVV